MILTRISLEEKSRRATLEVWAVVPLMGEVVDIENDHLAVWGEDVGGMED